MDTLTVDLKPARKPKRALKAVKVDANQRPIAKGDSRKPRWWLVNVGKKFTGTKKLRRYFDTEVDANTFIDDTLGASRQKGKSAFDIPQALAIEAIELMKKLQPVGATLTDAVTFFLRHAPTNGKKTVNDLIPPYLLTKKEGDYRKAQQIALNVFAEDFGTKTMASIFAPAIEKWFEKKGWKPLNKRNYMRDLSMFFRWAEMKDHVAGNPFDKIDRPKIEHKTPVIYTVEETRKILEAAINNPDLGLLPYYSIAFFSGVRVEELGRMQWEMIDWEENEIRLPAEITKTHQPRSFEIESGLLAALKKDAGESGNIVDPVNLRLRRES